MCVYVRSEVNCEINRTRDKNAHMFLAIQKDPIEPRFKEAYPSYVAGAIMPKDSP